MKAERKPSPEILSQPDCIASADDTDQTLGYERWAALRTRQPIRPYPPYQAVARLFATYNLRTAMLRKHPKVFIPTPFLFVLLSKCIASALYRSPLQFPSSSTPRRNITLTNHAPTDRNGKTLLIWLGTTLKKLQTVSLPLPISISKPRLTVCSRRVRRTKTSKARFPRSDSPPGPLGVLKANSNAHAGPLADIASWMEVEQKATALETLKPADVRFFCDNDKCMTPSKNCLRSSITYLAGI